MRLVIRFFAVVALALSPVWGFRSVDAASSPAPARYPVWPSFLSTGCFSIQGPGGSTTISCGQGAFLLTQVNSGYACNQLDINVSSFTTGPFITTATVNSGSQSNTIPINDSGNYYMQFPGFLVNNLITIQISAPDSGSMTIGFIQTNPCPVPTSTPTINPSSTATNTPVPVTGTPTPIPTHTPLPSGHSTFTFTPTPLPGTDTSTPTVTTTPLPSERDCGDITYPLLNCDFVGGSYDSSNLVTDTAPQATHWTNRTSGSPPNAGCGVKTDSGSNVDLSLYNQQGLTIVACYQDVVAGATGNLILDMNHGPNNGGWAIDAGTGASVVPTSVDGCNSVGPSQTVCAYNLGHVNAGTTYRLEFSANAGLGVYSNMLIWISNTYVGSASATPTPGATSTITPTPASTDTVTPTPTDTAIPIPGAMSTNIPTATECPGSCVQKQLTQVPGLSTRVTVDTSPFSAFTSLSLARSSCAPFGFVQIPYPVIHGTPALGSTTPLSITWTIPNTSTWDDTHPFSNTAIQPCAMTNEIPSTLWDFTYWLSVFFIAVTYLFWLLGYVGRLSGEETING